MGKNANRIDCHHAEISPTTETAGNDTSKCEREDKLYTAACMKSWRKYFDDRRRSRKPQIDVGTYK